MESGLTWCNDRVTHGRGRGAWRVWHMMRRDGRHKLPAARVASDGGDFCFVESGIARSTWWWWRCFDRRLGEKTPMKAVSLWQWNQLVMATGTPEFDGGGRAMLEMVEAVEEHQIRRMLHETLRALALIPC